MEFWIKASILLCVCGFFKEMKPSEPFLTPYLKAPPINLTEEQLDNQVYPIWTYSYLVSLFFVFLFTDFLRYKPVIIFEGLAYLATRVLLIWGRGVGAMQLMQLAYGIATGAEIAYYSYLYALVQPEHFRKVTSFTRVAVLLGRMMSGVVGQLLISLHVTGYLELNYISMGSVCIALLISLILPSASGNVFRVKDNEHDPANGNQSDGSQESNVQVGSLRENGSESVTAVNHVHADVKSNDDGHHGDGYQGNDSFRNDSSEENHFGYSTLEQSRQTSCCLNWFVLWKQSALNIWHAMKECYSSKELLKWSLWWALGTCGEFQVENYASNLWDIIYPSRFHKTVYNGGVTALSHLISSLIALLLGYWKVNWSVFGEFFLGIVGISDATVLYISAGTSSIWVAYLMYLLFRIAYTFLFVIASFQIAKNVKSTRYALVFGCNMFVALLLQSVLTFIVVDERGLGLDAVTQFVVYGTYFYILGATFFGKAIYSMTRKGWKNCWRERYVRNDAPESETDNDVPDRTDEQTDARDNLVV